MDIVEFKEPRTHVVIKNFLTKKEQEIIWDEIKENKLKFKTGKYKKDGKEGIHEDMKKNTVFEVNMKYPEVDNSSVRCMFHYRILQNKTMIEILSTAKSPVYQLLRFCKYDTTKISAYGNGDFYDWHIDGTEGGLLTIIYMMYKEPKKFTGGDILLKWDGVEKSIPFENNTILIFPRNTLHKVSNINMDSKNFWDKRFTIQCFANLE